MSVGCAPSCRVVVVGGPNSACYVDVTPSVAAATLAVLVQETERIQCGLQVARLALRDDTSQLVGVGPSRQSRRAAKREPWRRYRRKA